MTIPTRLTAADLLGAPFTPGRLSRLAFETPDVELRHYAPRGEDKQVPHDRDELYFVISGQGTFVRAGERVPFAAGDVLYAAAGETHRFERFSEDFQTWVLFYGPKRTG
jgi:oxalate decarboxylase/phosphoglucose isomerase-like protein (cupin superfamily)